MVKHRTRYVFDGRQFVSEPDARWAIFLEALGVPAEYVTDADKCHGLVSVFVAPASRLAVAVRPNGIERQDFKVRAHLRRCYEFGASIGCDVLSVPGGPALFAPRHFGPEFEDGWRVFYNAPGLVDYGHYLADCPMCGRVGVAYYSWLGRVGCGCKTGRPEKEQRHESPRMLGALWASSNVEIRKLVLP